MIIIEAYFFLVVAGLYNKPFARGKIPEKRTESLANWTFVREFPRGRSTCKSTRRKHFARGYTPGKKRGAQCNALLFI
jgi:hypothetical protein